MKISIKEHEKILHEYKVQNGQLMEQVDSMAHIIKVKNKEMRELSDFLRERNIPLKELSPLITVMNHVQELESEKQNLHKYNVGCINQIRELDLQNKRYREALQNVRHELNYSMNADTEVMRSLNIIDDILDGNVLESESE